jgi:hypothetical protein
MKKIALIITPVAVLSLAACGDASGAPTAGSSSSSSSPASSSSSSTPSRDPSVFDEIRFGKAVEFSDESSHDFSVTVGAPKPATCQWSDIGCDEPQTGDQVLEYPVTVKNLSTKGTVEMSDGYFQIEFPDGTRMDSGDGAALDYTPDEASLWDVKVRPGDTYKSILVFEAPKKGGEVIMMSSDTQGEDLQGWR